MFGSPLNKHWISFRRNRLGRPRPSIETRDDARWTRMLGNGVLFLWHLAGTNSVECRLLLQCIRVRAKDQGSS